MSAPIRTAAVDATTGVPTRAIAAGNTTSVWTTYAPAFAAFVAHKHTHRRPRT